MTVRAAILYPAVCISDFIYKAGMCGHSINTSWANLFCSSLRKSEPVWRHLEETWGGGGNRRKRKSASFVWIQNNQTRPADGNICAFSTLSCKLAFSLRGLFKASYRWNYLSFFVRLLILKWKNKSVHAIIPASPSLSLELLHYYYYHYYYHKQINTRRHEIVDLKQAPHSFYRRLETSPKQYKSS